MFVDSNDLIGKKVPEVAHAGPWLNSAPLRLGYDLRGHPALVTFWTSTDLNSLRVLPVLKAWQGRYGQQGLAIVGVHVPDFQFERETENIARFLAANSVSFPVLLDNRARAADAFGCDFCPSIYLTDAQGIVRYVQAGVGEYSAIERLIREVLRESGVQQAEPSLVGPEGAMALCFHPTPRLYCGYARGRIANGQDEAVGQATGYTDSGDYEEGHIYLQGMWLQEEECVRHARQTASPVDYLTVRYHALEVQVVMGSTDGSPVRVLVNRDGGALPASVAGPDVAMEAGEGWVTVAEPRLYALIADVAFGSHLLRLSTHSERLEVYALAFCG